ncbi:GroES-like superfamily protein [Aromatoleum petrolei]|nr:GroES-like superfamily protein [Aromatoleum petrolei]
MRTAIFKGAGTPLVIERRTDPVPGPGEVVARVDRVGACRAELEVGSRVLVMGGIQ